MKTFKELHSERYKGYAWTVAYEFESDGYYWGCDGSNDDEPDAWFMNRDEAIAFAKQNYPDEILISMLEQEALTRDANTLVFFVECWEWIDGSDEIRDEDNLLFIRFEKNNDGKIILVERQGI